MQIGEQLEIASQIDLFKKEILELSEKNKMRLVGKKGKNGNRQGSLY